MSRASEITTGAVPAADDGELGRLRTWSGLTVPAKAVVNEAVVALRTAADKLDVIAGTDSSRALAVAGLLAAALAHYHERGEGPCPVCGQAGALDESWRTRTESEMARLKKEAEQAKAAHDHASSARQAARQLIPAVPDVLAGSSIGTADPGAALVAWRSCNWVTEEKGQDALRQLACHIEETSAALREAVGALAVAATSELRTREDKWAPVASEIAAWCTKARRAEADACAVPALATAIGWLKDATDDLRNARLAPLAAQSRAIWSLLRQESNVDLGSIRLSGSGPRRQVNLHVTVDQVSGAALGVMSQGEVNALALSIFLPRATVPESPFRFLVIDDPVQAMDPAKVEGLAQVLADVARARQVLVFTHDDRLPGAVRRLGITASILEVSRQGDSQVQVRAALTAASRHLKDAQDLCADDALPTEVAVRVVPGMCRLTVEATLIDAIRRRQLRDGKRHADVEAAIETANTLNKKAALAMFGDVSRIGDVVPRLNNWQPGAATTYKELNKGAHDKHDGSLHSLIGQTRSLTQLIEQKLS